MLSQEEVHESRSETCNIAVIVQQNLRFFASDADVEFTQQPGKSKDAERRGENDNRLPEAGQKGVVVGELRHKLASGPSQRIRCTDSNVSVPEVIDNVQRSQLERCTPKRIHESAVSIDLGRDYGHSSLILDVAVPVSVLDVSSSLLLLLRYSRCTLWQDDAQDELLVLDTLSLLGTLHERNLENIGVASLELPQIVLEVGVPSHSERVLPASKYRVSWLQLEQTLSGTVDRTEARRADISNVIDKVRVQAPNLDGVVKLLEGGRGWVVVLLLLPSNTGELLLQIGSSVLEPVTLLGRNVASPMTDLDVALYKRGMK